VNICQNLITSEVSDAICILPAGHAGPCDRVDAMGLCQANADCRATREGWPSNGHQHNHR